MEINKNKTGLTFGFLISFVHLCWSILVALGIAEVWLNFVFSMHMIDMQTTVMPFNLAKTIGLIIITFIVGYILGWLVAFVWNKCLKG